MRRSTHAALAALLSALLLILSGCGGGASGAGAEGGESGAQTAAKSPADSPEIAMVYQIGICTYVEDASLNQIVESLISRLTEIGVERNVRFAFAYECCDADEAALSRIVAGFLADKVDLMVGITTPVAAQMRSATEGSGIPVVFAAVSDPEGAGLVASNDAPGGNLTGTSDCLDTTAVMDLLFALNPGAAKIGLLYDQSQDASAASALQARAYLQDRQTGIVERTGTSVDEVMLAARSLAADGVDAVFTPTDHTILRSERSICETFAEAGIPHIAGAEAFARNGAFLGCGADDANLGAETADMAAEILLDGADPAVTPVRTLESGFVTVNTEICAALGLDPETVRETIALLCAEVRTTATADSLADRTEGT